eukprot:TRINITY_DN30890_c0_g1_i1.p1 TRINITY_DN30890_c0_g1~~TRINITY_DN30890_c0_g1_i1.p1  ORF type:complete len:517 (+),score=124.65 TRINITY_DN30890_c0_g1_i1:68-1552(+)
MAAGAGITCCMRGSRTLPLRRQRALCGFGVLAAVLLCCGCQFSGAFVSGGRPAIDASRRSADVVAREAGSQQYDDPDQDIIEDLFSRRNFRRKALILFESRNPFIQFGLYFCIVLGGVGFAGLLYNVAGEIALNTAPGAKPGLDSVQGLGTLISGFVLGIAGYMFFGELRMKQLEKLDAQVSLEALACRRGDGSGMVKQVGKLRGRRVLALFGKEEEITSALQRVWTYRRRFEQSKFVVVSVGAKLPPGIAAGWLAEAEDPDAWTAARDAQFATGSAQGQNSEAASSTTGASWLALGKSGQVRGQGSLADDSLSFDQLLSFFGVDENLSGLPPRTDASYEGVDSSKVDAVLSVHDAFYDALKVGNWEQMQPLWMKPETPPTGDSEKARIPWASVLTEGADVLDVVDVDVVFAQAGEQEEAIVTSIEVCRGEGGMFNEGGPGGKGTLLATKRFRRDAEAGGEWRLLSHQTLPYCKNTLSTMSLRCNCGGCILLKR